MTELIEGAMQQAPHPGRHFMSDSKTIRRILSLVERQRDPTRDGFCTQTGGRPAACLWNESPDGTDRAPDPDLRVKYLLTE
jgi:hypothetical protein